LVIFSEHKSWSETGSVKTGFTECTMLFYRTLDDMEMYEKEKLFRLQDYVKISEFLNSFVFRVIWNNLIGKF